MNIVLPRGFVLVLSLSALASCGSGASPRPGATLRPGPSLPLAPQPVLRQPNGTIAADRHVAVPGPESELLVRVWRDGLAGALAHDHVIEALDFRGEVAVPRVPGETGQVVFEVDARSLRPDRPELRRKAGLPGTLSDSDRQTVLKHMQDSGQLDVARYPRIRFVSSRVVPLGGGTWDVEGMLGLHGTERPIRTVMQVIGEGGRLRAKGNFRINTSSFGIRPYEALGGLLRNKDQIEIQLDLVLDKAAR
ncbi:MAG: YceI family protein [Candidatus Sericytochromatia bacterium]|nr:YceI family protein [Candidatus Sericytochromatia bacterium]